MRQSKQVSILCDTNILIYYMLCTPRFIKDVMKLFERCVEREVKLSCASLSLKDVFYITGTIQRTIHEANPWSLRPPPS